MKTRHMYKRQVKKRGNSSRSFNGRGPCLFVLEPDDPLLEEKIKKLEENPYPKYRINHMSWWERELPSRAEMGEGLENLRKHGNRVDYILTHCTHNVLRCRLDDGRGKYRRDCLSDYFQEIRQSVAYKYWLFGHFHTDRVFKNERSRCLYRQMMRLL